MRDRSAAGRFPSINLGILEDVGGEEAEPEESETHNACGRWLRKLCPCCRPKAEDDSEDALVPANDGDDEEGEAAEKPESDGELEGTRSPSLRVAEGTTPSTSLWSSLRSPPQGAICRPAEEQPGGEPDRAPHPPLPDRRFYYS